MPIMFTLIQTVTSIIFKITFCSFSINFHYNRSISEPSKIATSIQSLNKTKLLRYINIRMLRLDKIIRGVLYNYKKYCIAIHYTIA